MTRLAFERLEPRRMLAGWQNPGIRFDVNDSGDVQPLDALVVINDIGRHGSRELPSTNDARAPYVDVNADGWVTPLDALLVLNALHRNQHPLNLVIGVSPEIDRNANGVVVQPLVELRGQTSQSSRIVVEAFAVDSLLNVSPGELAAREFTSDANGRFVFDQHLLAGRNRLRVTVTDEIGRQQVTERELVASDVVTDWNAALLNAVRDWTTTSNDPYPGRIVTSRPPEVARDLALVHVAMFDAINRIEGGYSPYTAIDAAALSDVTSAASVAAAAMAAHDVAIALYPQPRERAVWTATLAEALASVPDAPSKQHGIEIGKAVAAALLARRENDGSSGMSDYAPGDQPGQWNRTAPAFLPPLVPHWGSVKPLAVENVTAFRPEPPPALDSQAYADAVDEVMRLGRMDSNVRTAEQTAIAVFWVDGGGTATPPGHWNRIAMTASLASGESMPQRARTMALVNLAMADAGIASWDAKYHYDLWRPIDAIRRAEEDGNAATTADAHWLPLILTPPFPAYTSGHSSFSGAAATVLTALYGNDLRFATTSDNHSGLTQKPLPGITTRQFGNFWDAAEEASMSRIYGGIHYKFDSTAGLEAGKAIGTFVIEHLLRPR